MYGNTFSTRFTLNAHETNKPNIADYISVDSKREKRTFKVMVGEDQKITVHHALQLLVIANGNPLDHLKDKKRDSLLRMKQYKKSVPPIAEGTLAPNLKNTARLPSRSKQPGCIARRF